MLYPADCMSKSSPKEAKSNCSLLSTDAPAVNISAETCQSLDGTYIVGLPDDFEGPTDPGQFIFASPVAVTGNLVMLRSVAMYDLNPGALVVRFQGNTCRRDILGMLCISTAGGNMTFVPLTKSIGNGIIGSSPMFALSRTALWVSTTIQRTSLFATQHQLTIYVVCGMVALVTFSLLIRWLWIRLRTEKRDLASVVAVSI
jgi:hypothetical protein